MRQRKQADTEKTGNRLSSQKVLIPNKKILI